MLKKLLASGVSADDILAKLKMCIRDRSEQCSFFQDYGGYTAAV